MRALAPVASWPRSGRWFVLLLTLVLPACEGLFSPVYPPVPAERYFAGPALAVAQACQHDEPAAVAAALQAGGVSPNAVGEQGMSLLLLAMSNRSVRAVQALLAHGADPNLRTALGAAGLDTQPVALAAGGDVPGLLRLLLARGGDPNARFAGDPATFCAADHDRYDHLRLLLERGADINATNEDGYTLAILLAERNEFEQVAYLIQRGADVHKADNHGGTVAYAVQNVQGTLIDSLEVWNGRVKALLEARGVRFPVPHPGIAFQARVRLENAQRRVWQVAAPEGRHWLAVMTQDDQSTGHPTQDLEHRYQAENAFQAWRKTQPKWTPSTTGGDLPLYSTPPTLEEEAAQLEREKAANPDEPESSWKTPGE